jgi:hypothetical protein
MRASIDSNEQLSMNAPISMRRFIEASLYGTQGFFRNANLLISSPSTNLASPTQLSNSLGQAYRASAPEAQFATASTIFRHDRMYASAVHRWLPPSVNTVVEVGGGSGALACDLLAECERVMSFHHVEISPELAEVQRKAAAAAGVAQRHRVHVKSFFDWNWAPNRSRCKRRDDANVALLAFEVFDNLACDKLVVLPDGAGAKQAFVETPCRWLLDVEVYRDVSDSLVSALSRAVARHARAAAPTCRAALCCGCRRACFSLSSMSRRNLDRKLRLLIADFDELPNDGGGVVGVNAPLVQRKSADAQRHAARSFSDPFCVLRSVNVTFCFRPVLNLCVVALATTAHLVIEKHADFLSAVCTNRCRVRHENFTAICLCCAAAERAASTTALTATTHSSVLVWSAAMLWSAAIECGQLAVGLDVNARNALLHGGQKFERRRRRHDADATALDGAGG